MRIRPLYAAPGHAQDAGEAQEEAVPGRAGLLFCLLLRRAVEAVGALGAFCRVNLDGIPVDLDETAFYPALAVCDGLTVCYAVAHRAEPETLAVQPVGALDRGAAAPCDPCGSTGSGAHWKRRL